MRLERMGDLCRQLGIPRRTFQDWIKADPDLAVWIDGGRGGGSYWVKLDKLAGRFGIDLVDAYTVGSTRWVRAADLAKVTSISRWTIQNWCRDRPGLAKRIGRNYWIDLEQLGASEEEVARIVGDLERLKRKGR